MILRNRSARSAAVVPGLLFLAVANVGSYMLRRSGQYPESVVDGASGLLMGIAIALLLTGIWVSARGTRRCGRTT